MMTLFLAWGSGVICGFIVAAILHAGADND
jgi:hypothetical protein